MSDTAHRGDVARPEPGGPASAPEPTIKVAALREGTVIDHLPAGTALKVLSVLGIKFDGAVTIGLNLDSGKLGRKDIIKIERREVTPQEVAKIALISPRSSFSIIRDFQVARKFTPSLPEQIENLIRCPNPSCISNSTWATTKFTVLRTDPLRVRCFYCERSLKKEEIELQVSSHAGIVIDGYDLLAETGRYRFADRVLAGRRLNRGTATVAEGGTAHAADAALKSSYAEQVVTSTLSPSCPVVDLSYPVAGMFVDSPAGVYLDLYQGVAQKLFDDQHPRVLETVRQLVEHGLAFRREIATDDYLELSRPLGGLRTPRELAALVNGLTRKSFPSMGECRTFFSNSGAESGEAALKLAQLHCYRRLVARHGRGVLERLMADLGIARDPVFDDEPGALDDPLYLDYPFVLIGCDGAFHGRTLGVLNLTRSRKAQHLAFSKIRWRRHIPFNGRAQDLTDLLDTRPLPRILDAPGGVAAVFAAGKVPAELVALFAVECVQGEGGYRIADRAWLRSIAAQCGQHGILLGLDEVQTFGRTGALYAGEHYSLEPDLVWTSKAAVVGLTVVRAGLAEVCHVGWHSNTFGGGKLFDVNLAYSVIDTLVNWKDPLFEGRSYLENSRIKGEYARMRLAELCARHADVFRDFSGLGGMWGLSVRHREELIETGWRQGAKLLGCGRRGPLSRLRIVLLTDVLTREIDELIAVLGRTLAAVSARHEDDPPLPDDDEGG